MMNDIVDNDELSSCHISMHVVTQ